MRTVFNTLKKLPRLPSFILKSSTHHTSIKLPPRFPLSILANIALIGTAGAAVYAGHRAKTLLETGQNDQDPNFITELPPHLEQVVDVVTNKYHAQEGWLYVNDNPKLKEALANACPELLATFAIDPANITDKPAHIKHVQLRPAQPEDQLDTQATPARVYAGGIMAVWAAFFESLVKEHSGDSRPLILVLPPENELSNSTWNGSSLQFHKTHDVPMNSQMKDNNNFSAADLAIESILRALPQTMRQPLESRYPNFYNPRRPHYSVGDIPPSAWTNPDVLRVGFEYFIRGMEFNLRKTLGVDTVIDGTLPCSILGERILRHLEQPDLLGIKTLHDEQVIRITDADERDGTKRMLEKYGATVTNLSLEEIVQNDTIPHMGNNDVAWYAPGDGYIDPNIFNILTKAITDRGGTLVRGNVTSVLCHPTDTFYTDEQLWGMDMPTIQHHSQLAGVVVQTTDGKKTIATNNLMTSFGPKVTISNDNHVTPYTPGGPVVPGTGVSLVLLVEGNVNTCDRNNNHFTKLDTITIGNTLHTVVKSTCGGNLGEWHSNKNIITHHLALAQNMFRDPKTQKPAHIEVLSVKFCSRAINGMNSVALVDMIPGSDAKWGNNVGPGGKGNTDAMGHGLLQVLPFFTRNPKEKEALHSLTERLTAPPAVPKTAQQKIIDERLNRFKSEYSQGKTRGTWLG